MGLVRTSVKKKASDKVVGSFVDKSTGKTHEYSRNDDDMRYVFPHKIWTPDGFRYAHVSKTFAHVSGEKPLSALEKWKIKQHKEF